MRLNKIEKRIIEIKKTLADPVRERDMGRGLTMDFFEKVLRNENRPLEEELEQLILERDFIIDKRENFLWKALWNVAVPVLVSVITTFIVTKFLTHSS